MTRNEAMDAYIAAVAEEFRTHVQAEPETSPEEIVEPFIAQEVEVLSALLRAELQTWAEEIDARRERNRAVFTDALLG